MKRVLIITYHWPPMGGGGVQRWLKTCKYLRDYSWEPIIFTVLSNEISNYDESLVQEIPDGVETLRIPIWEPFGLYKKLVGKKKEEKVQPGFLDEGTGSKFIQELAYWVRGNVFIPDAKRFWIRPARKALEKYLNENQVNAIVSTGPPHTTHMIALDARLKFGIPWLADFRDPWTFVDYYDKLKLSKFADREHHRLEKQVIESASKSVTVSWSWADAFNKMGFSKKVEVITNGYDPADFVSYLGPLDSKFSITHVGSMNADRNPHVLWKVLEKVCNCDIEFKSKLKIRLIGPVDHSVLKSIRDYALNDHLEHIKNLPHSEVIPYLQKSQLLLLPLNDTPNIAGVVPGKLFEYLGARRPIFCIGDNTGDSARIIREVDGGVICGFKDEDSVERELMKMFIDYRASNLTTEATGYRKYGRDKLAGEIVHSLQEISS